MPPTQPLRNRLAHGVQHRIAIRHELLSLTEEVEVLLLLQSQPRPAKQAPKLDELELAHVLQVLDEDLRVVLVPRVRHVVRLVGVEDAVRPPRRVR